MLLSQKLLSTVIPRQVGWTVDAFGEMCTTNRLPLTVQMQGLLLNTPFPWYKTFVFASAACPCIYASFAYKPSQ